MVGITLFFGVKNQTRLWVVLVGLLFSSILCAQGVDVIDHKGTKNTITTVSADAGNLINTGSDEGAYLNYQNIRSNVVALDNNNSAYSIGLPADSPSADIDNVDIIIFANPGGGTVSKKPVTILPLNSFYDGKIITIVEHEYTAPEITVNSITYNSGGGDKQNLFTLDSGPFTSVSFIWVDAKTKWFILQ